MHENPYDVRQLGAEPISAVPSESTEPGAGFGLRLLAYFIDIVPITLMVSTIFYVFFGMNETFHDYLNTPRDLDARQAFLRQRNQVRDFSFLIYTIYGGILEGTAMQATLGKKLLGLRVTDKHGKPLTVGRALGRSFAKSLSALPCGLGFLWILWSPRAQAWHDSIAGALVVKAAKMNTN